MRATALGKINHCGKNFAAQNRYVVTNYPGNGDITYFDYAKCEQCNNNVHSYWIQYFRAKGPTQTAQSDKHDRHKFDDLIRGGMAFIIPTTQDEVPRDTRAQVLACEWTLTIIRPADLTYDYINKNLKAPWVSNRSILAIEQKRKAWLSEYVRNKSNVLL